ncbi:MAG TPA: pyrroline-5-carboxylate reductase [bacterium]|jgi:pyrroline-5-carboxylate reductase|nr:pyrroline-5-carboxylate reductase [bacterium]
MKASHKTVVFGIGAMGSALVKGWISSKMMKPSSITAVDPDQVKCKKTAAQLKIKSESNPGKTLKGASLILLAVKPQQMKELLAQSGSFFPKKALVVSIAAGVSIEQIEKALPQGCPVIRVMPNTPALLGSGMAAVAGGQRAKPAHVKLVLKLFSAVGQAVQVEENQMDLVTAVSGSGPAYFFHMVEAMVEAGIKGGLSKEVAHQLVAQTIYGAARMVLETGKTPTELRIQVTSPGGTTQAALTRMAEKGFRETIYEAVEAATQRGAELRQMSN